MGLQGKRIVVTRAEHQAQETAQLLREKGAKVYLFPVIEIVPADPTQELAEAINKIDEYDWILLTSSNAVSIFINLCQQRLGEKWKEKLRHKRFAVIGPKTGESLEAFGLKPAFIPGSYKQEDMAVESESVILPGSRLLYPKAEQARALLPQTLSARGVNLDDPVLYRTIPALHHKQDFLEVLTQGQIDVITFTSSSTVRYFIELFKSEDKRRLFSHMTFACIGPITAQTAEEAGLEVKIKAQEHTIPGLIKALEAFFNEK
jgi:uroporphyrinogen III methyltransferase/synthase